MDWSWRVSAVYRTSEAGNVTIPFRSQGLRSPIHFRSPSCTALFVLLSPPLSAERQAYTLPCFQRSGSARAGVVQRRERCWNRRWGDTANLQESRFHNRATQQPRLLLRNRGCFSSASTHTYQTTYPSFTSLWGQINPRI